MRQRWEPVANKVGRRLGVYCKFGLGYGIPSAHSLGDAGSQQPVASKGFGLNNSRPSALGSRSTECGLAPGTLSDTLRMCLFLKVGALYIA